MKNFKQMDSFVSYINLFIYFFIFLSHILLFLFAVP